MQHLDLLALADLGRGPFAARHHLAVERDRYAAPVGRTRCANGDLDRGTVAELEGLIWATGHWRNGVLLAPLTGDAVADLLAGDALPGELEALSPRRFGGVRA